MDDSAPALRYVPGSELGRGRRSIVTSARDSLLGRDVALKQCAAPADEPLLWEEARRLSRILDPRVVALFDVNAGPPLTLVLQHLAGRTLRAHLSSVPRLPLAAARPLARDLLAALQAVHGAGIVHGDVKPENLWVTPEGRLMLLDLGALGDVTALYQAPETLTGPLSPAADLYSAGVVIYEMLAGCPPFDATDPLELGTRKRTHAVCPAASHGAVLPEAVEAWLVRALAPDPAQRWPDATSAGRTWEEASSSPAEVTPGAPFVLHPEAWDSLQEVLTGVRAGLGGVRVLAGERGLGKSTLAAMWGAAASASGITALRVSPVPEATPFAAWRAALRALPAPARRPLRSLVPRAFPAGPPPDAVSDEAARIAARLAERARRSPWAAVFDGWQDCDAASREVALRLAEHAAASRIAVVLVVDERTGVAQAGQAALARPGWLRLELAPPARERWPGFVARLLGTASASDALCDDLWSQTGGQPLCARLLLDALRAEGALRFDADSWIYRPEKRAGRLPPAVRDLLAARWERCPGPAHEILSLAAVQGARFEAAWVAERLGQSTAAICQTLQELAASHGIVRREGGGFVFHPPLWADFVLDRLAPEWQREEHAHLAAVLERQAIPDDAALGVHLARAGRADRALPHLERAAQAALERADFATALAHAEEALAAAGGEPADEAAARQRAALGHLRARSLQGLAGWDAADEELQRTVMLSRAWGLDDLEMRLLRTHGEIEAARGRFEPAIEHFLEAQLSAARLGAERELHELGLKVGNIHFERGDLATAASEYERALAYGTQSGDFDLEARAANNVALVHSLQGRKEQAVAFFGRSLERFRALGRDDAVAQLDQNIGQVYLELGNWAEARNSFERCMRQCEKTGQDALLAVACLDAAEANLKLGSLPEASRAAERALALARERDDAVGIANAMRVRANCAAAGGDLSGAEASLLDAIERLERLGQPLHLGVCWKDLGAVRLRAGRVAPAAQALARARTLFASLDAAQHAAETEALFSRCGEVESCNLP